MGPFDVIPKLFSSGKQMSIDDRINYYFVDPNLVPLMVQDNFPKVPPAWHNLPDLISEALYPRFYPTFSQCILK